MSSYRILLAKTSAHHHGHVIHRRVAQHAASAARASSSTIQQQQQKHLIVGGGLSNNSRIRRLTWGGTSSSISAAASSSTISSPSSTLLSSASYQHHGTVTGRHFYWSSTSTSSSSSSSSSMAASPSSLAVATALFMVTTASLEMSSSTTTNVNTIRSNTSNGRSDVKLIGSGLFFSNMTSCESPSVSSKRSNKNISIGLADEDDDNESNDTPNTILLQDGMDASVGDVVDGGRSGSSDISSGMLSSTSSSGGGPADADDDNHNVEEEEEEDDDPSNDEETTCSICLINRRGPCRKYWLKFEKCMKDHHGAEKKKETTVDDDANKGKLKTEEEEEMVGNGDGNGGNHVNDDSSSDGNKGEVPSLSSLEEGWDAFMEKSIRPGEDDEEEEDDDEEEEEEEEDDSDDDGEEGDETTTDSTTNETKKSSTSTSLAERCDRHMIPWIGCIQRHRNTYSLISNEFYQGDYIDPLEYSIPDERRALFNAMAGGTESKEEQIENKEDIDDNDEIRSGNGGYMVKFNGVKIDLESWKEHIDAETDDDDDDDATENGNVANASPAGDDDGPHLINASAKFRLMDPNYSKTSSNNYDGGGGRIEVAYIKDQRGRLLGFDSFNSTKKDMDVDSNNVNQGEEEDASNAVGECTFHIVPGETTSIVAYAIYRGKTTTTTNGEGQGSRSGGTILREDVLYHTPEIPLPGISTK